MTTSHFFDSRETRTAAEREAELSTRLPALIAHAQAHAPAMAAILAGVNAAAITSRSALVALPVTRKSELQDLQKAQRPFGGFAVGRWGAIKKVYASPGPIYEPEGGVSDYARIARALFAAGIRAGDLVHNSFAYHMTPGGWIMDAGATALGCAVFPGGVGNTDQQIAAMQDLQPTAYAGTPSFLRILLEKADELGTPIRCIQHALVSGEYFAPQVRALLKARGIQALQCYATADAGLIAYETPAMEGMVIDEDIIVEIVRPGTGDPVAEGEVGEVVVTTFNQTYPLVRFGTGDLSAVLPGVSPCGRSNARIKGWMGRADQTVKVKGMFVHPSQIAALLKRHPEIVRGRLTVTNPDQRDAMALSCETAAGSEGLGQAVAQTLRDLTKLGGEVTFVAPGALPNDGKVIDDQRKVDL
jgi:phenylacetate-CoA ligase